MLNGKKPAMNDYWLCKCVDIGFFVFHISLILFNLLAWIWARTRKWHLVSLLLIVLSWFGLGIFYGWGYCFITDWHWGVRRQIGLEVTSNSYIHFLILETTGVDLPETLVDQFTFIIFFILLFISLILNIRDLLHKRRSQ